MLPAARWLASQDWDSGGPGKQKPDSGRELPVQAHLAAGPSMEGRGPRTGPAR